MKKEMLFKIGLVNKSSVQTIKDTTTFYTSDTELWLGFELLETELLFDSAEILLLNKDDRSFIVRSVKQEQGKYWYELESDIIAHHGEWLGQLQFNKDEEAFTSKKFGFRIENDLSNDRPPQLTEVNNWKNLRITADGLIDDLRVELESLVKKELEIENAETTRQQAESKRQSTFETNEINRQNTFETAEQSRQSAELFRIENEKQRVLNYENMQETIDMIGKVKLTSAFENGDFSKGTTNWMTTAGYYNRFEVVDGVARNTEDSSTNQRSFIYNNTKIPSGHITYHAFRYRQSNISSSDLSVLYGLSASNRQQLVYPKGEDFNLYTGLGVSTGDSRTRIITSNIVSNGEYSIYLDYLLMLDLTDIFGAGNEPSKSTMDWIINNNGYFDELTLRRDDIQQYEINQLRKAVIALGGTV